MEPSGDAVLAPAPAGLDLAPDALARFRRRGRLLFTALAFLAVIIGGAVTVAGSHDRPPLWILVAAAGVLLGLALDVVLVFALAERRIWADRATVMVCTILLVTGLLRSLVRLTSGTLDIPLDAIGAAFVLAARPASLEPRVGIDRWRLRLVVAAAAISAVWPLAVDGIASGRILGANPDQVAVTTTIDCAQIRADPEAPIVVHASWAWTGGELLAGATDGFAVDWAGSTDADAESAGALYVQDEVTVSPDGAIWRGSGSPATALIDPIEEGGNAQTFGIDVARFGLVDGRVVIFLRPTSTEARHGSASAKASYAHLDRWLKQSEPASCDW